MQSAAKCPILVSFFCRKYEGPDKYFEKKLKMKKEMMKQLVTILEQQEDEFQFQDEPDEEAQMHDENLEVPDEEDKGELFINQLSRPVVSKKSHLYK